MWRMSIQTVALRQLMINACAFCGQKAQGHFLIQRDGVFNEDSPDVPLCDACGGMPHPTTREIWAKISLRDDHGEMWPIEAHPCESNR